jgi:curved DNA-binding protein CbpA
MSSDYDKDPYDVLGVPKDADDATIKKAYRKLALQHHPDRKSDPGEKAEATRVFADISGAYEILTDDAMRKEWDRETVSGGGGSSGVKSRKGFKFNPSDPYEIWKRDFELQFGRPYPGAVADVVSLDTHIFQKREEGPTAIHKIDKRGQSGSATNDGKQQAKEPAGQKKKLLLLENGHTEDGHTRDSDAHTDSAHDPGEGAKTKKKGFLARLFCKKEKADDANVVNSIDDYPQPHAASAVTQPRGASPANSAQPRATMSNNDTASHSPTATKPPSKETALVVSGKNKKDPADPAALALRSNERSIVEHAGHDNRPISMEVSVEEGADGSTITTTTITRPDGTVEKCVQRTGIPGRDPKKNLMIEGEKSKLAIEADKKTGKKKLLAIDDAKAATNRKDKPTKNEKGQLLLTS